MIKSYTADKICCKVLDTLNKIQDHGYIFTCRDSTIHTIQGPIISNVQISEILVDEGIGVELNWKNRAILAEKMLEIALYKYAKLDRKTTNYNKMTATYYKEIKQEAEKELDNLNKL